MLHETIKKLFRVKFKELTPDLHDYIGFEPITDVFLISLSVLCIALSEIMFHSIFTYRTSFFSICDFRQSCAGTISMLRQY